MGKRSTRERGQRAGWEEGQPGGRGLGKGDRQVDGEQGRGLKLARWGSDRSTGLGLESRC